MRIMMINESKFSRTHFASKGSEKELLKKAYRSMESWFVRMSQITRSCKLIYRLLSETIGKQIHILNRNVETLQTEVERLGRKLVRMFYSVEPFFLYRAKYLSIFDQHTSRIVQVMRA